MQPEQRKARAIKISIPIEVSSRGTYTPVNIQRDREGERERAIERALIRDIRLEKSEKKEEKKSARQKSEEEKKNWMCRAEKI